MRKPGGCKERPDARGSHGKDGEDAEDGVSERGDLAPPLPEGPGPRPVPTSKLPPAATHPQFQRPTTPSRAQKGAGGVGSRHSGPGPPPRPGSGRKPSGTGSRERLAGSAPGAPVSAGSRGGAWREALWERRRDAAAGGKAAGPGRATRAAAWLRLTWPSVRDPDPAPGPVPTES